MTWYFAFLRFVNTPLTPLKRGTMMVMTFAALRGLTRSLLRSTTLSAASGKEGKSYIVLVKRKLIAQKRPKRLSQFFGLHLPMKTTLFE